MKRCNVKPYDGDEKYIFISYCHKDNEKVFPVIEQLAKDGYRVWYDEGIDPGTEWPEIIASHLNKCSICIAFISNNSINSHNCRREVNFALMKKKKLISVIIEQTEMSLGMEMQLSATQAIFKYKLDSDNEFFNKLYDAKDMLSCLEKNGDINSKSETDKSDNIKKEKKYLAYFMRNKTGLKKVIDKDEYKIGRSETSVDFIVTENSHIGRYHAKIIKKENKYYLIDNNSLNKTRLNYHILEPQKEYLLSNGDIIQLSNEKFTFSLEESD